MAKTNLNLYLLVILTMQFWTASFVANQKTILVTNPEIIHNEILFGLNLPFNWFCQYCWHKMRCTI